MERTSSPSVMRIDLHAHSEASHDCTTPVEAIPGRCLERGISVQAITDHDEIDGALELARYVAGSSFRGRFTVIVGEEVTTASGEIIGLFLRERIAPGGSAEDTVAEIRAQGGLVLLPHGFDPLKRFRLQPDARERVADGIDLVEVFNARISRRRYNRAATEWGEARGLALSGGSDAHTVRDLGSAWVEAPFGEVRSKEELLERVRSGTVSGEWTHPVRAFAYKKWVQLRERLQRDVRSERASGE